MNQFQYMLVVGLLVATTPNTYAKQGATKSIFYGQNHQYSLLKDSIVIDDQLIYFKIHQLSREDFTSSVVHWVVDCKNNTFALKDYVEYDQTNQVVDRVDCSSNLQFRSLHSAGKGRHFMNAPVLRSYCNEPKELVAQVG